LRKSPGNLLYRSNDRLAAQLLGGRGTSYYIYYVTKQGKRIIWAESYDGSKENTLECFYAAREFLGMATEPSSPGAGSWKVSRSTRLPLYWCNDVGWNRYWGRK